MLSTVTVISTDSGKKKSKFDAIHFYCIELTNQFNWFEKSIQLKASSWCQIFYSSWLYICISIQIFQLIWNICDCFFHCAAWAIIRALLVRRFYNCIYGQFPPHFTLVINHLKHQFDQSLSTFLLLILDYESNLSTLIDHQVFLVPSQYFVYHSLLRGQFSKEWYVVAVKLFLSKKPIGALPLTNEVSCLIFLQMGAQDFFWGGLRYGENLRRLQIIRDVIPPQAFCWTYYCYLPKHSWPLWRVPGSTRSCILLKGMRNSFHVYL